MNAISIWNHNAYFDYFDRWVAVAKSEYGLSDPYIFGSNFVKQMWLAHR